MAEEIKTGIEELDAALSGNGPKHLHFFVGRGSGKSVTTQIVSKALQEGGGTINFNVEMVSVPIDEPPDNPNTPRRCPSLGPFGQQCQYKKGHVGSHGASSEDMTPPDPDNPNKP